MAGEMLSIAPVVSITLKSKIRYNGREYSSVGELPAEIRAAYEKARRGGSATTKFVVNGQVFTGENAMPADVRKLCDDVLNVIETNGEVTIPNRQKPDQLLTRRELGIAVAVGAVIAGLVLARIFHG